jgi:serine protease inhibitor
MAFAHMPGSIFQFNSQGVYEMKRLLPFVFSLTGIFAVLVALSFFVSGCATEIWEPPRELNSVEKNLVTSSNQFGFTFFNEMVAQSEGDNIFVSPLSVSLALGMTYNGARGTTEEGMRACLQFGDLSPAEINQGYRGLIDLLTGMDSKVKMEIANSIWYRQGFSVLAEFLDAALTFFDAIVSELDFDNPDSADVINDWVAESTHDKIDSIVEKPLPNAAVMFLINAVYFKGTWVTEFDKNDTHDATFHAADGDKTVKMMALHESEIRYLSNQHFSAVNLPYGRGLFSMTVILPNIGVDIDEVVAMLNSENWAAWMGQFQEQEMDLYLPRFELEYEKMLNETLIALGMQEAFSTDADFTGINPAGGLFISKVKHKSYVKVNEEGTEAAAVTSVQIDVTSVGNQLRIDRPFIFVIHDSHSQALLFMGKIVNPDSE